MQLLLATAGAAIGSALGGLTGAQIGWTLGSIGGAVLFGPRQHGEGPRLQSLTVSTSSYGVALPLVMGMAPAGGNVIWASPIKETKHEERVGKGGGGSYTTYTYSCSFMVAICEGEIAGVRRIWANEKLIYDNSANALPMAVAGSQRVADNIRILTGAATQMPSALIESFEGAGNVPGYRGVALAEFTDFELGDYGNALPNLKFEVVANGTVSCPTLIRTYTHWDASAGTAGATLNQPHAARLSGSGIIVQQADDVVDGVTRVGASRATVDAKTDAVLVNAYPLAAIPPAGWTVNNFNPNQVRNDPSWRVVAIHQVDGLGSETARAMYFWPSDLDHALDFEGAGADASAAPAGYISTSWDGTPGPWVALTLADGKRYVFQAPIFHGARNTDWLLVRAGSGGLGTGALDQITGTPLPAGVTDDSTGIIGISTAYVAADEENRWIMATTDKATTNRLYVVDAETMQIRAVYSGLSADGHLCWPIAASAGRAACLMNYGGAYYLGVFDLSAAGGTYAAPLPMSEIGSTRPLIAAGEVLQNSAVPAPGLVILGNQLWRYTDALTPAALTLRDVVERLCIEAGYAIGEVDASDLASISVPGYIRNQRMAGAAQLQLLSPAYSFDVGEVDAKVVAKRRGAAPAATLTVDDLLLMDNQPSVASTRAQETELPRQVDLSYLSQAADYTPGTQSAQRIATTSQQQQSTDAPLVLADVDAAAMAARMLWEAWIGRTARAFALGPKWSKLAPMDVVTLPLPDGIGTATVRLTAVRRDGIKLICEAVDVDAAAFTQPGVAGAVNGPGGQSLLQSATAIEVVDLPSLRDGDDGYGIYVAAGSLDSDWPGAAIYIEPSGGSDPLRVAGASARSTIGRAATALPDAVFGDGQIDPASTVDIDVLYGGLPASISLTELLNSSANTWLIGDEVVQARTVAAVFGNRVRLSDLVRGLRGTAAAKATHAVGERAVLLGTQMADASYEQSWVGNRASVVGVTLGQRYSSGARRALTLSGARIRPLPPALLRSVRQPSGDLVLMWQRRARLHSSWQGMADVPLDEATELYKVEILSADGATVLRTITGIATTQVTYTAALQTADFGYTGFGALTWRVRQISARVGDGTPAQATTSAVLGNPLALLMHFDGGAGSTVFTDSSPNGFAITAAGGATQSSSWMKFGASSGLFNGSSAELTISDAPALQLGGDWTIDFWFNRSAYAPNGSSTIGALAKWNFAANPPNDSWAIAVDRNTFGMVSFCEIWNGGFQWHDVGTVLNGVAAHVAFTRSGGVVRGFLNGVKLLEYITAHSQAAAGYPLHIGRIATANQWMNGYLDELRILNGFAAWVADFTPPASPYTD